MLVLKKCILYLFIFFNLNFLDENDEHLRETSEVCKEFYAKHNVEDQLRILGLMPSAEQPALLSPQVFNINKLVFIFLF